MRLNSLVPELPCSERSRGSGDAIWSWGACCGFTFTSSLNRGYRINYNPNYAQLVTGTARKLVTNGFAKRALFSENLSRRSTPTYGGWCHSQNVNQQILISIVVSDHGEMKSSASQRGPNMEFFPVLAKTSFHQVFFLLRQRLLSLSPTSLSIITNKSSSPRAHHPSPTCTIKPGRFSTSPPIPQTSDNFPPLPTHLCRHAEDQINAANPKINWLR